MDHSTGRTRKRTQCDYTLAFKLSVLEQVEKGELTYKQAQNRYGIQGRSTVLSWLRKHGKLDWISLRTKPMNAKETPEEVHKKADSMVESA